MKVVLMMTTQVIICSLNLHGRLYIWYEATNPRRDKKRRKIINGMKKTKDHFIEVNSLKEKKI